MAEEDLPQIKVAITVINAKGIIITMNDTACNLFSRYGGRKLIGENILTCHPEPARSKLMQMLETGEKNQYTNDKPGVRQLIYQLPWHQQNRLGGYIEINVQVPHRNLGGQKDIA